MKWRVVIIEDAEAAVPRVSHAQLLEKAREQWSEVEIAEALGADAARIFAATQPPTAAASFIHDAVRAEAVDALQVVAADAPLALLAGGLRPPHRQPGGILARCRERTPFLS